MADPVTLASVGPVALTEGVKFLYAQASQLVKWWLARKTADSEAARLTHADVQLPDSLGGKRLRLVPQAKILDQIGGDIREIRNQLGEIVDGTVDVRVDDADLLSKINTFRDLMERVYSHRFDFVGEIRPTGAHASVSGRVHVETLIGYAASVRAGAIASGVVEGHTTADTVASGARAIGVDVEGTIGAASDLGKREGSRAQRGSRLNHEATFTPQLFEAESEESDPGDTEGGGALPDARPR